MSHRPSRLRQAEEGEGTAGTGIRSQRELKGGSTKIGPYFFRGLLVHEAAEFVFSPNPSGLSSPLTAMSINAISGVQNRSAAVTAKNDRIDHEVRNLVIHLALRHRTAAREAGDSCPPRARAPLSIS
jgi:hypothetical protein